MFDLMRSMYMFFFVCIDVNVCLYRYNMFVCIDFNVWVHVCVFVLVQSAVV